ncbi:MAG: hypothetical protein UX62_C0048G0004 [Microgenomates group bacterium GW2011_GWA2_46_7]|nr:MAG: hypothetical protein UX62_C0048G0004 [Microgenomates group bacterium GW2011_GWA2_46_7]
MTNVKLYTVKEAAKIVGVSTNTLYKYLDEDRIHAARGTALQGRFRIPEVALEEFLGISLSSQENSEPLAKPAKAGEVGPTSPIQTGTQENGNTRIPVKIARFLLILALLAVLLDLFIARSVSLPGSISRLIFLAVMLLLAY